MELAGDALKLVVVADTHSRPDERGTALIRAERPDAILHAGDIGDLAVLDELQAIAPLFAVRGNIDVHARSLPDVMTLDVRDGASAIFRLLLLHIAVYGPKLRADTARLARSEGASLVVCGHSHVPFLGRDRGFAVFNPGSIGPRRFQLPILFGVIDITRTSVDLRHVDCETGQPWLP